MFYLFNMNIRSYHPSDYKQLATLYKHSDQFKFDEVTDSEVNISRKIERDPDSLLVSENEGQIVGSVSIIEDGRIAILFRLVASPTASDADTILQALVQSAGIILKERGFREMHNTAPTNDLNAVMERQRLGFKSDETYTWFWKKI